MKAVNITNPQTWNRYAYVTNDPCSEVDPLGLFSSTCQFSVAISNQAGLSVGQISAIQTRVNNIFGATTGTNGESVGVNFVSGGSSDASLTFFSNASPVMNLALRNPYGAQSWYLSPRVYVNNIPDGARTADVLEGVGAHELGHEFTGFGDLPYSTQNTNILMFDNAPAYSSQSPSQAGAFANSNSPLWKFTPQQVSTLYKKCAQLHPNGGGGSGGADGFGGGLMFFQPTVVTNEGIGFGFGGWIPGGIIGGSGGVFRMHTW